VSLTPRLSEVISERFDDRFTYFLCMKLFTRAEASALSSRFPTEVVEYFRGQDASHAVLSSTRHEKELAEFLRDSLEWRQVCNWFTSREFVEDVLNTFSKPILSRYPIIVRFLLRRWILDESRYYSSLQFSVRHTGSILSPHTDNADKVLALVVYFPEENESKSGGGTAFYLPRTKSAEFKVFSRYVRNGWFIPLSLWRLRSTKLPTSDSFHALNEVAEHLDFFDSHYELVLDAPYELGCAGGFIKNQFSWHDLRLHDFPRGGIRKSLLVNVFLRPSKFRAIINRLFSFR